MLSYFADYIQSLVLAALSWADGWKSTGIRKITKHSIKFLRCSGCAQYLSELTKPRRKKSEPTKKKFWDTYLTYTYFSKLRLNSTSMAKIARYSVTSLLTILFNICRMGGCVIFAKGFVPLLVNNSVVIFSSSFWMSPKTKGITSEYAFSIPSSWKKK